jgi:REP element-mobilizing transposase RayT
MKPYTINHSEGIYFCTDTIISFAYVFVEVEFFEIIVNSLKYCQKEKGLKLIAYVIMPNHVHTIVTANNGNLSDILRDYKQYTSRKITETLHQSGKSQILSLFKSAAKYSQRGNQYKVWQPGSHPQLMDYDEKLFQKIEYIHNNPVRKGYVEKPECWVYSSARNYIINDDSIIEIQKLW